MYTCTCCYHCQLFEVVEEAIGDVGGLHSKLDRKTTVETSNAAATQKLQTVHV